MIQTFKFAHNSLSAARSRVLIFKTLLALASVFVIGVCSPSGFAQSGPRSSGNRLSGNRIPKPQLLAERPSQGMVQPTSELTLAREKAAAAKKKFDTIKRLSRLGSASQKQLRDAELLKWLALLDLSNLVSPEKRSQNTLLRAKLIVNYRNKELKVINKLYERGSASALELQRVKTARDVAESRLKAVESVSVSQRKINIISAAGSNYEAAQKEHLLATKLFQSGSISQAAMDRASSNLGVAESELAEAKESLGARAVEVQQ